MKERRFWSVFWRVGNTLNLMYFFDNHEATHLWKPTLSYKETHSAAEQMLENQARKDGPVLATAQCPPQLLKQPKRINTQKPELWQLCSSSLFVALLSLKLSCALGDSTSYFQLTMRLPSLGHFFNYRFIRKVQFLI